MPVVSVTAPAPADAALLRAVADAVAAELELGPGDVIATLVVTGETVASGGAAAHPWPIVTIHGSDRGAARMRTARAAAESATIQWAASVGLALGGVWTEWVPPGPPR